MPIKMKIKSHRIVHFIHENMFHDFGTEEKKSENFSAISTSD